ncbi:unnamed protein product [Amoebophrya sp. A120]|nr:unnamed protein product [Amoebophrya sp. A120]|eukprot:GSA120T00002393001.1
MADDAEEEYDTWDDFFGTGFEEDDKAVNPNDLLAAAEDFDGDALEDMADRISKEHDKLKVVPDSTAATNSASKQPITGTTLKSSSSSSSSAPSGRTGAASAAGAPPLQNKSAAASSTKKRPNVETLLPTLEEEEEAEKQAKKQPTASASGQQNNDLSKKRKTDIDSDGDDKTFSGFGPQPSAATKVRQRNEALGLKKPTVREKKIEQGQVDAENTLLSVLPKFSSAHLESVSAMMHTANNARPDNVVPVVHNCVASFQLQVEVDLQDTVCRARNIEYNPKKAPSLIVRHRDPRATALVYETGRVMITGARSPDEAKLAGKKVAKMFQKIGYPNAKFTNYQLENLIAIADLGFPLRLEGIAYDFREYSSYEPEMFSGLVWNHDEPKMSILVFVSGKIVITGAKTTDDMYLVLDDLYPKFFPYQK